MSLKVSNFDPCDPLTGAELVGVVQSGTNRRTTVAALASAGASSDVTLNLTPSLAAYPATNSAAAINALIAALPRGGVVQYPGGHYLLDGRIDLGNRVTARGQGPGVFGTDASATTLLEFPAGCTGFRVHHTGGKNSRIEGMRVIQTSLLSTSVLASYVSGATTISLASAGDFQNGQVVQLDGAGDDIVLPDRAFTTTNGSAVVTWVYTDGIYRGNSIGYLGQEISLAGFAAGTTILSWGIGTATLSTNCTAPGTVIGLTATITTPLITEIISGGGTTTLTIADIPFSNGKTVSGRKLSHCAPAIYSTTQCHTRDFDAFGECQAGMVLCGITTGGAIADNGTFFNSYFAGTKFGVILQGEDAQVNTFFGCNFAGAEVGVLDNSFIENDYVSCHWAFNCGLMGRAAMRVFGGYMEGGTSYISSNGASFMLGTVSFAPGSGFQGFASGGAQFTYGNLEAPQARLDGAHLGSGNSGFMVRFQPGQANLTNFVRQGEGIEAIYDGTRHWWYGFNASGGANDKPWRLDANGLEFFHNATGIAKTLTGGLDLYSGKVLSVNGTQVVGAQGASLPADATDLATALILLNAIKARMKATGGHGLVAD